MRRILLIVAYDGTAYSGFQAQKSGARTIEGELNRVLTDLTGETVEVIGASRTDAGVHALCNMAVFDTDSRIPPEKYAYAVNSRLPDDIAVRRSLEVPADFHPRRCRTEKTYAYRIYNAPQPSPLRRLYTTYSYTKYDVARMARGAAFLKGEHDFKSFCSTYTQARTTVRTITDIDVYEEKLLYDAHSRDIVIRVSGTGFLYNMVRIIAGTLMEVGRGAMEPETVKDILDARDRRAAGPTAPPQGLTLVQYRFLEENYKKLFDTPN